MLTENASEIEERDSELESTVGVSTVSSMSCFLAAILLSNRAESLGAVSKTLIWIFAVWTSAALTTWLSFLRSFSRCIAMALSSHTTFSRL